MTLLMITIFVLGYACIALEHKIKTDKASIALFMFGLIWSVYALFSNNENCNTELLEHLGSTCETLVFLIGAMTIVELIDTHGGFHIITEHITTHNKNRLLWMLAIITFFMSAVLDNMTTTIIMVMMLRRIISNAKERWFFAGVIIIAANSGGAWSPIGDITTIMLWMRGNVTTLNIIGFLIIPCLVSLIIPTYIAEKQLKKIKSSTIYPVQHTTHLPKGVSKSFSRGILFAGIAGLLFVPIFKSITGLPPYVGIMFSLGCLWIFTEFVYGRKHGFEESAKNRVSKILQRIDMPTILFFLGILMSVAGLQSAGVLGDMADFLDKNVHEVFSIASVVGILSSIIDNVPLVAACMGMYPVADPATIAASVDPAYMQAFMQDGLFWLLLTYCAGVGGSLLIIGSAAGVVAMGLEKIDFTWYLKNITFLAFIGYAAGIFIIYLESLLLM